MHVDGTPGTPSVMPKTKGQFLAAGTVAGLAVIVLLAYFVWFHRQGSGRNALLSWMPAEARTVFFVDLADLRKAPFFADLLAWAPKPDADQEYRQFLRDTGFDYEKDLDRLAVAFIQQGPQKFFLGVADGHFDPRKIKAYAAKSGTLQNSGGVEFFSLPIVGTSARLALTFLTKNRLAFTNNNDFHSWLHGAKAINDAEWREHFARVAGSPVFVVVRDGALKDAFGGEAGEQDLARGATGGFSSPQLSSLLAQLQWLSMAGKPENNTLRVALDAESREDKNAKQLEDLLNGVALLARLGLSNAKTQQQLSAATRQSYLALLKSVEVSRIDRPDTKSIRLMFKVTPDILKSAPNYAPAGVPALK